jgi:hypothetical protein
LCNLAAQSTFVAEGSVSSERWEETYGAGIGTMDIIYFKPYKTQIPVVEQAIEVAALMLGRTSRGAIAWTWSVRTFWQGRVNNGDPTVLLQSMSRFFRLLPGERRRAFLLEVTEKALRTGLTVAQPAGWEWRFESNNTEPAAVTNCIGHVWEVPFLGIPRVRRLFGLKPFWKWNPSQAESSNLSRLTNFFAPREINHPVSLQS